MNGMQVAREIRKLNPSIPIIILSAYGELLDESLGIADIWIRKGEEDPQYLIARRGPAAPFSVTGNYTVVRAREERGGTSFQTALTPAHSVSLVGVWEKEHLGRIGLEYYFTGGQRLESNPYRDRSAAYSIVGVMADRSFGKYRVYVNAENLTGVRQSKYDPLVRPAQAIDGRWSVDAWAPLDGRSLNAGIRVTF